MTGKNECLNNRSAQAWPAGMGPRDGLASAFSHNLGRELEAGRIFYFFARNPLKSHDSEK
jgi:hypothetical protein